MLGICTKRLLTSGLWTALAVLLTGCGDDSKTIRIDGSSTVFPVSMAVAEDFAETHSEVKVAVNYSGTGGGFKRLSAGEIDICDASREITESELQACRENGVEIVELSVAFDGLAVAVNPAVDWVDCITVEELKTIWEPEAADTITQWSDVNPDWPDEELELYGPGTDSGTFDYFTAVIMGEEKASRPDYTASENDNALVRGVIADEGGLGYFGFAYYTENKDELKLLAVDDGSGCVKPSAATVGDGTYKPLSRPLYIYVRKSSLKHPEVETFVKHYLEAASRLVPDVGYVPVSDEVAEANWSDLEAALAGE